MVRLPPRLAELCGIAAPGFPPPLPAPPTASVDKFRWLSQCANVTEPTWRPAAILWPPMQPYNPPGWSFWATKHHRLPVTEISFTATLSGSSGGGGGSSSSSCTGPTYYSTNAPHIYSCAVLKGRISILIAGIINELSSTICVKGGSLPLLLQQQQQHLTYATRSHLNHPDTLQMLIFALLLLH